MFIIIGDQYQYPLSYPLGPKPPNYIKQITPLWRLKLLVKKLRHIYFYKLVKCR